MLEADALERGQLVDPGRDDRAAGDERTLLVPRQEAQAERRDPAKEHVRTKAERGPHREVPGEKDPRRRTAVGDPRVQQRYRRDRREHHRGHHRHPDPEEPAEPAEVRAGTFVHPVHALVCDDPGHERAADQQCPDLQRASLGSRALRVERPELLAEDVRDLADRDASAKRLAHRRQQVRRATRDVTHFRQRALDVLGVSISANARRALELTLLSGRVEPVELDRLRLLLDVVVDADDDPLARARSPAGTETRTARSRPG